MPCTVSSIMSRIASKTLGSPSALMLCSSERNRKCSAGLRRDRRGVRRRHDGEIDIAGSHQLQDLRLLSELRAGILVDQHGALAQFLELGGKYVVGDAVAGIELLIVGEAIMFCLPRARTCSEQNSRSCDGQACHSL